MGPPYKQNENFTYEVLGIKLWQKECVEFISEGKYSKMKIWFFIVLGPPYKQNENLTYEVLGIKIG